MAQREVQPQFESTMHALRQCDALSRLVGEAPRFLAAIERLPSIAGCSATVIVTGETGTGKELIARALHYLGPRRAHPFVPVNCGALPDTLLEDELFGHEHGAFTDAKSRRAGLVAQAEHGTLFLDEIDTLSPRAQVALLRVLQEGTYRMLGGEREFRADVRFVAASNRPLSGLVASDRFRRDLYYRLSVLAIHLPALRERVEDILPLARHFLQQYAHSTPFRLSLEAERALIAHAWPGNVRELENVIQRSITMAKAVVISEADLDLGHDAIDQEQHAASVAAPSGGSLSLPPFNEAKRAVVEAFERSYLEQALRANRGNVSRAAQSAQKERRDFGRLLKKHRLDPRAF